MLRLFKFGKLPLHVNVKIRSLTSGNSGTDHIRLALALGWIRILRNLALKGNLRPFLKHIWVKVGTKSCRNLLQEY